MDANGILNVSAKDKATGKAQNIRIEASSGLTDEEIKRMKADAEANAEADRLEKERIDTFNMAEAVSFQTDKDLKEYADRYSDDMKSEIENAHSALKDAMERKDVEAIKSCIEILQQARMKAGEAFYKNSQPEGETPNM